MDGLGAAASIISVVSLAVQLGDSVYKLSRFLKSIKDAPKELDSLRYDLDRLQQILAEVAQVAEMQQGLQFAPAPSITLFAALEECRERFQSLEAYASKMTSQLNEKGLRKAFIPLKIPIQKDALQVLHGAMRQSIDHLGTLLILNNTKVQLSHMSQTQRLIAPSSSLRASSPSLHDGCVLQGENSHRSPTSYQKGAATTLYAWYESSRSISCGTILGLIGYCVTNSESYFSKREKLRPEEAEFLKRHNWSIILTFWLLNRYFEFQSRVHCGQIERRWRVCPVDPWQQSPVWRLCRGGDTQGVLKLFSQGVSPYITDEEGSSLLNVASMCCHTELCRVLLQQGVPLRTYQRSREVPDEGFLRALFNIHQSGRSMHLVAETIKMLMDHQDEPVDAILAIGDRNITYLAANGVIHWYPAAGYRCLNFSRQKPLSMLFDVMFLPFLEPMYYVSMDYVEELSANSLPITLYLRQLGQAEFSITYEKDLSVLDAVFDLGVYLPQVDIWHLEATSEDIGREFCSILDDGGINAQAFIGSMMNINDGNDVYLRPVDYGVRGVGGRRLVRGKFTTISLRWEWDPPPEENPYPVLEVFACLNWKDRFSFSKGRWPFTSVAVKSDQQRYIRRQGRKGKKAQRKDKIYRCLKRVPGAFPD